MAVLTSGCVYRFTSEHMSPPRGVHTLAVEAVYDTSREVLPHELLWESLQQAFAKDGHMRVVPQGRADALLRAHIKQAAVTTIGDNSIVDTRVSATEKIFDPRAFSHDAPPRPELFRDITQAGEFRMQSQTAMVVEVEIWNLETRAILLKKTYPVAAPFRAERYTTGQTFANNDYLRYDEAERANFKTISDTLAGSVVSDLLVR